MCPLCIGSALLALTGAGSAGGLAIIVARVASANTAPPHPVEPSGPTDQMTPPAGASARNPDP